MNTNPDFQALVGVAQSLIKDHMFQSLNKT